MLNEYNYKLLKEDIKNGKQIILFLGAGVNYCKNHRILWADVMAHLFGHALMSISCDKNIDDDDLVLLKRLFNIPSDNGGALDVSLSLDLHKYVQDEYPSVLQAYIVKKILGGRYISIIQDFLYTHCNAELIKNAFEANHVMGQKPTAMDDDYACLFEVARLILLCPNIKAVVTYNYDNFLTKAIEVLQSEPDKYFSAEELKLFERRVSGDMEVVDIYGDDYDRAFKSTTFPVYHVHGYIPDRNEFQTIDDTSIVLSLDEFYDNVRNVYSWQTDTQMHLLSHYTHKRQLAIAGAFYAAQKGEHTIFVLFDKNEADMRRRMFCPAMQIEEAAEDKQTENNHKESKIQCTKDCITCHKDCKLKKCYDCYKHLHFFQVRMGCISAEEFFDALLQLIDKFADVSKSKPCHIVIDDLQKLDYSFPFLKSTSLFLSTLVSLCREKYAELKMICDKKAGIVDELCSLSDNVLCIKRDEADLENATIYLERNLGGVESTGLGKYEIINTSKLFECDATGFKMNMAVVSPFRIGSMKEFWRKSYNIIEKEHRTIPVQEDK